MKEDIKESYRENAACICHVATPKRNTDVDLEKSKNLDNCCFVLHVRLPQYP